MTTPWKKDAPKTAAKTKLTPASIVWARQRATKAGRHYPNLVDNMAAARRQEEKGVKRAAGGSGAAARREGL
ncbi:MAG: hypothetical protein V4773_09325 [Verrucomicrobiota bacterium]